jgi:general secretion pathway protein G
MMVSKSSRNGFTLIELLIVLSVLAIIAGAALPLTKIAVQRGKEIELRRNLRLVREAIDQYKKLADEKKFDFEEESEGYPPTLEALVQGVELKAEKSDGVSEGKFVRFLRRIPKDPMTNSFEWGLRSYQDDPESETWGKENVYDVYSKSEAKALDGSRYKDW